MSKLKKSKLKKYLKNVISVMLAVSAMSAGATAFAIEGEEFTENFNSYKAGALPTRLDNITGEGAKIYVDEIPDGTNKSVALEGTRNNAFIQRSYSKSAPLTGKVYLQADFRFGTINNCPLNIELRASDDTSLVAAKLTSGAIIACDGSIAGKYIENKFYTVGIELDLDNGYLNIYVNGRNTVKQVVLKNLKDIYFIRFQLSPITAYSKINIDNLIVKSGSYDDINGEHETDVTETGEDEVKNKMIDAAAFYENRQHALINGVKKDIDCAPFSENGNIYLPLRVCANNFGAGVDYDSAQNAARVIFEGMEYLLKDGESSYWANGEQISTAAPIKNVNGRTYACVDTICGIFGKYAFEDKGNGLVIFSNEERFISWEEDIDLLNEIVAEFIYTDYSADELIAMLREHNPDNMHPRIMATPDTFKELKENIKTDVFLQKVYQSIETAAESYMNQPVQAYNVNNAAGQRLLDVSRKTLDRVANLAFMYNMTGEERYAERAWQELYTASYYPDWNEIHFLDVAEMSAAFAIGYDWLYNWLSEDKKQRMRTAMINYGLNKVMDDYEDNERTRTYYWSTVERANNWTLVCNGGLAMAAAAIFDDEAEELCGKVLENGLVNVRRALKLFAPSGSYGEGSNYWNYATRYYAFYLSTLQSAFGSDLGYFDVPGMRNTVEFVESMNGPAGYYNFSDSGTVTSVMRPAQVMLFGDMLDKPYLGANRINDILQGKYNGGWEDIIYYKNSGTDENQMPLDKYSDIVETMAMRSSYNDDALYLGFHNGDNGESHSHLDLGGFILDSQGERFIMDLGSDNYNLPDYRNCYRIRAEGHNTLVINPDENSDQSPTAIAKIVRYESKPRGAYAIADLTEAYAANANKVQRGIMMAEGRGAIVVSDELDLAEPSEVYWFAHTDAADIELSEDGRTAVLTKRGKKLKAEVLSEGRFEIMDAKPLPTSPVIVGQNENVGIKKLAIHYTNMKDGTISVGFAPYYDNYTFEEVKPLDEWAISDGELEYACIDEIRINGIPLEGFNKDIYAYTVKIPADSTIKNTVSAAGTINDMREEGRCDGTVIIEPESTGLLTKPYVITFEKEAILGIPDSLKRIPIVAYTASDEPQPDIAPAAYCFDDDLTTRWACLGHNTMDMDLGSVHKLYGVGIAFWHGDQRSAILRIEVSEDGENYKLLYEGDSCGESENYEIFEAYGEKARYVRAHFYGTSEGTWNSILDIAILEE